MITIKEALVKEPILKINNITFKGKWTGLFLDRFGKSPIYDYISADERWQLKLTTQEGNTKSGNNKKSSSWDIFDMNKVLKTFSSSGAPLFSGRPLSTEKTLSKAKSFLSKHLKTIT